MSTDTHDTDDDGNDNPEDNTAGTDLPEALLIDPDRADLLDPQELFIRQEQTMSTTKDKAAKPRAAKGSRTPTADLLPPLQDDGSTQIHGELPPPPLKETVLFDGPQRRLRERGGDESVWSEQVRTDNAARLLAANTAPLDDDPAVLGLNTKAYMDHAGDAARDATRWVEPLLNPFTTYINDLYKRSDMHGYLAVNAITTSMGYAVVAQLLAEHRKLSTTVAPPPDIDVFAGYQDDNDDEARREHSEELGYVVLPPYHAIAMTGVYKKLLYWQRADIQWAAKWPPRMPHEVLHEMQTGARAKELMAAYAEIDRDIIGRDNPALANIEQALKQSQRKRDEANALRFPAERDHVLAAIRDAIPSAMTDEVWDSLPLYIRYRYSKFVYDQYLRAIASQRQMRERGLENLEKISDLSQRVGLLHLEIAAAFKLPEVRAAFEQGKLDDRHDIRIKADPPAEHKPMHRAPPPPEQPDPDDAIPPL